MSHSKYAAHIRESDGAEQTVKEHLEGTAALAKTFGDHFDNGDVAGYRIIYVIPYNSIIEQNAKVFEDVLGAHNVLQHHSGVDYNDKEDDIFAYKRLATENWDIPVVVTTAVQFFESLFANKSSKCRKLYNIANSVIIFDEAQLMPIQYLMPCTMAISELVTNYGCTVVLCSATQPALNRFFGQLESRELYGQAREAGKRLLYY